MPEMVLLIQLKGLSEKISLAFSVDSLSYRGSSWLLGSTMRSPF